MARTAYLPKNSWMVLVLTSVAAIGDAVIATNRSAPPPAPFTPDWASLDARPTPAWWREAKFAVSLHWGVYSVPAYSVPYSSYALGEWYGNYIGENQTFRKPPQNPIQDFHDSVYGADFEYSDFVDQFKAELYNPDDWAKLFKRAGVKWAILTSKHHDGFELWDSPQASSNFPQFGNNWTSVKLGPKRDLLGDFMSSLRKEGLRAGIYHSLFEWYNPLYRGSDPSSYVTTKLIPDLKDLVTRYQPDDILVDGEWERDSDFWQTKDFLQWLFNDSPIKDTVSVDDRWGNDCRGKHGGYYVCENGGYSGFCNGSYGGPAHPVEDHPWIYWATTCPEGSWGFSEEETADDYDTAEYFTNLLISSVVDGGSLMLNLGPTHRGTLPAIQQRILIGMGDWLRVNGEAIFNTTARARGSRREDEVPYEKRDCGATCQFGFPFAGLNNVYGVQAATSQPGIEYLGKTNSPVECQEACAAFNNNQCRSYTWHQPNAEPEFAYMCYGRTNDTWTPTAEGAHVSGRRGDSVFSSAVQYTQSGSSIYAHFNTYPASETLVLSKGPWPDASKIAATFLGLGPKLLHVAVSSDGSTLTVTLPRLSDTPLPSKWSWVVKLTLADSSH